MCFLGHLQNGALVLGCPALESHPALMYIANPVEDPGIWVLQCMLRLMGHQIMITLAAR